MFFLIFFIDFIIQLQKLTETSIFVTLPPEMSRIATWSFLGYSQFPKGGAIPSSLAFQQNHFLQSFLILHQKNTLVTHTKSF